MLRMCTYLPSGPSPPPLGSPDLRGGSELRLGRPAPDPDLEQADVDVAAAAAEAAPGRGADQRQVAFRGEDNGNGYAGVKFKYLLPVGNAKATFT